MVQSEPMESEEARSGELRADSPRGKAWRWLLLAALLHGVAYLFWLPPWMGEDEPWHLEYAHHVASGHMPWGGREVSRDDLAEYSPSQAFVIRELGGLEREEVRETQRAIVDSMATHHFWERVDWASWSGGVENFDQVSPYFTATHQPPLYYLISGTLMGWLAGGDLLREMWVGRGFALLCYLAVVLAAYEIGRRVSTDTRVALAAGFLAAWWPMHARQAAVVNNDVLVKVASAWALVLALDLVQRGLTWKRAAFALGLAGIALALKTTAAGVLVPLGLALVWRSARSRAMKSPLLRWVGGGGLLLLVGGVIVAYRFSHNPAIPDTLENLYARFDAVLEADFRREFARTSVGAFNWYSRHLPGWLSSTVGATLALLFAGALFSYRRRASELSRAALFLCLAGALTQLSLVALRGTAVGRYAIPMLPAFAALLAVGALIPIPERGRDRALALLLLALFAFDGYFAGAGLLWNQYGVWGS